LGLNAQAKGTPLMKIRFASFEALVIYQSMAEGMSEVREDENSGEGRRDAAQLDELIAATGQGAPATAAGYPCTIEIRNGLREIAEATLETCMDNASGASADDPDYLKDGDVVIDPS
jgi:hypothetical protein